MGRVAIWVVNRREVFDQPAQCEQTSSDREDRNPRQDLSEAPQHPIVKEDEYKAGCDAEKVQVHGPLDISDVLLDVIEAQRPNDVVVAVLDRLR